MSRFRIALNKVNVWKVRVVALSFLVLLVGGSSQALVNAMAAGTESETLTPSITTVILKSSAAIPTSTLHIHLRRAGVDTPGGYKATNKR